MTNSTLIPRFKNDDDVAPQVPVEIEDLGLPSKGVAKSAREAGMISIQERDLFFSPTLLQLVARTAAIKVRRKFLIPYAKAQPVLDKCREISERSNDPDFKANLTRFCNWMARQIKLAKPKSQNFDRFLSSISHLSIA